MKFLKDEKGQTLLFVVAAMIVSLVVGAGIAMNIVYSTSSTTAGDSAMRALAAAEACIERFLALSNPALSNARNYATGCPSGTTGIVGTGCQMTLESGAPHDVLTTEATATVVDYGDITPSEYYTFDVSKDSVMEVSLRGYGNRRIRFCWSATGVDPSSASGEYHSDFYYIVYGTRGANYASYQGGIRARNSEGLPYSNDFPTATDNDISNGYNSCYTITWPASTFNTLIGLRLMSLNYDSTVGIRPIVDNLPLQGYEITCTGEVSSTGAVQKVTRVATVRRSYPFMSGLFDFGIYSQNDL